MHGWIRFHATHHASAHHLHRPDPCRPHWAGLALLGRESSKSIPREIPARYGVSAQLSDRRLSFISTSVAPRFSGHRTSVSSHSCIAAAPLAFFHVLQDLVLSNSLLSRLFLPPTGTLALVFPPSCLCPPPNPHTHARNTPSSPSRFYPHRAGVDDW